MLAATKRRQENWLDECPSSSDSQGEKSGWHNPWKADVPAKLHMFLWRLARVSLLSEDVHHQQNMSASSACSLCGAEDTWCHSFIEWSMARCVWALVDE